MRPYTPSMSSTGTLDQAHEALRLVQVDPGHAARVASRISSAAQLAGELGAASVAERALGLAALHVQDLTVAHRHLRSAMTLAQRAGSAQLKAEAQMTYAFALTRQGRPARALAEIGAALQELDTPGRARALAQRGAIFHQLGRLDEALADYRAALPSLRRADDLVWVQRVYLNRGVLHAFRHEYHLATRDLLDAERLCKQLGLPLPTAFVHENLGLVHRRLGDVPRALHHLGEAERLYASVGAPLGSLLVERSELLLSVGLFAEAREAGEQAVEAFERAHRRLHRPEARLLLARLAVLDGDPAVGVAEAECAVREFRRQGRAEWVALARCAVLLARLDDPSAPRVGASALSRAAAAAETAGWPATALEVRLRAGQVGLLGRPSERALARRELLTVSSARYRGPAARRAKGWLATALLRQEQGDRRAADAAARRGLRILEEYRGTMNATDLRARVSGHGVELARLGLRNAVAKGSPRQLLMWAELGRARHLLDRSPLPPQDAEVSQLLASLRAVVAEIEEVEKAGGKVTALLSRQVTLEHAIRDATRLRPGSRASAAAQPVPARLTEMLGGRALVEFVELDDTLYAVCVAGGRTTARELGPLAPVRDLAQWLPFSLSRLSRQRTTAASAEAAVLLLRKTARQLDDLLLRPVLRAIADRDLVIVPTGILQSMPWSLLPTLAGRPLTVAPSASLWQAAMGRSPVPGHVVVVAGPGLPGGFREAAQVAALYGDEPPLFGSAGTAGAVTQRLDGAALFHVAAHGTVRADNPLFSSLRLFDGPLTVYDLERLDRGADTVVLASCEGARDVAVAGDEMLGLSAAFLARDTRHVVGSVVPVPDAATRPLMVAFHRLLARGLAVAPALAQAQQHIDTTEPTAFAASAGFVCIGAGFDSVPLALRS